MSPPLHIGFCFYKKRGKLNEWSVASLGACSFLPSLSNRSRKKEKNKGKIKNSALHFGVGYVAAERNLLYLVQITSVEVSISWGEGGDIFSL